MANDPAPRPRLSRNKKIVLTLVLLILWSMMASSWFDKGCSMAQSYGFVFTHAGPPDGDEGCESGIDGPEYTGDYYR